MPYKSRSQMRLFFAKEKAGELPKGTARRWAHETKNRKKLPEHVKKAEGPQTMLHPLPDGGYMLHHSGRKFRLTKEMTHKHFPELLASSADERVKKAFWEGFEKEAARRRQKAHGRPQFIPKDPFKQIQRRMIRKSRTYYT